VSEQQERRSDEAKVARVGLTLGLMVAAFVVVVAVVLVLWLV
jgi:hypothetical protein